MMTERFYRVFLLFFFFSMAIAPCTWGEVKQITILYSNNINGQIHPSG